MDNQTRAERYQAEEDDGRDAVVRWLRHPRAREVIMRARPGAEWAVEPIADLLPDHVAVTHLGMRAAGDEGTGYAALAIDGSIDAGPFNGGMETLGAADAVAMFSRLLHVTAVELADVGALIDPEAPSDLIALTQLLLLEVDWSLSPAGIAARLNVGGPSAMMLDGRGVAFHPDYRGERGWRNIGVIRADWRERQPDNRVNLLKSKGGRPSGATTEGSCSERLLDALLRVLPECPGLTAGRIRKEWTGRSGTAGRTLRDAMGLTAADQAPAERTLERALKIARDELRQ